MERHWPGDINLIDNIDAWYEAVKNVIGEDVIEMIVRYNKLKSERNV